MKLFEDESIADDTSLAGSVMDTAFDLARLFRQVKPAALTVSQYRALSFIACHAGASLSLVAEHLGLALPSTSKLINDLVMAGLVARDHAPENRRALVITLTPQGVALLARARSEALAILTLALDSLPATEREAIERASGVLRQVVQQASQLAER